MFWTLSETFTKYLLWISLYLLTHFVTRMSFQQFNCNVCGCFNRCFKKCCIENNGKFEVSHSEKTPTKLRDDIKEMMFLSTMLFFVADVPSKIDYNGTFWQLLYIPIPIISAVGFGMLGEMKGCQTSCSSRSCKDWPIQSTIGYIIATLFILFGIIVSMVCAAERDQLLTMIVAVLLLVLFIPVQYFLHNDVKRDDMSFCQYLREIWKTMMEKLHIHHVWIGLVVAGIMGYNNILINIVFLTLYGVHVEGASNYGFPDLFND